MGSPFLCQVLRVWLRGMTRTEYRWVELRHLINWVLFMSVRIWWRHCQSSIVAAAMPPHTNSLNDPHVVPLIQP